MNNDANSNELPMVDVENTNLPEASQGTQENDNSINTTMENVASTVDYQKKFSESSKEAQRLYEENKMLREQFELKGRVEQQYAAPQNTDILYPGYEDLDEEARNNLVAYTENVTKRAVQEINKNPAIAYAMKQYSETTWNNALEKTIQKYPELASSRDEFKSKYYNASNVPENIESILSDIAKIHLFDKAKDIGAKEATELNSRVELERTTAGAKDPTVRRSLDDWARMSKDNPAQFAKLSKEFNDDMSSGKI